MAGQGGRFSRRFLGFRLGEADIRLIRIFCVVAEAGGLSAAQSELQMSMPAISRAVSGLEDRIDAKLCTRGRRGFMLTEAGERVLQLGAAMLGDLDRFEREVRQLHAAVSGKIRIGMVDCILCHPDKVVPRLLDRLKGTIPGLDIQLSVAKPSEIELGLGEGRFDAGIIFARRQQASPFSRLSLYEETSNLYCAPGHPLAAGVDDLDALARYDYAGYTFSDGGPRTKFSQWLRRTASADQIEALATLVATGRYIGFLPDHYVAATPVLAGLVKIMIERFAARGRIDLVIKASEPSPLGAELMREARAMLEINTVQ